MKINTQKRLCFPLITSSNMSSIKKCMVRDFENWFDMLPAVKTLCENTTRISKKIPQVISCWIMKTPDNDISKTGRYQAVWSGSRKARFHRKLNFNGFSTKGILNFCISFRIFYYYHPRNFQKSVQIVSSNQFDQIDSNNNSM